jgi:hypothetical protein
MSDPTQETNTEVTQINLVDLQNVVRVIDAAAERGAFKGNELTIVGGVRDKIVAFLAQHLPAESNENVDEQKNNQTKEDKIPTTSIKKKHKG